MRLSDSEINTIRKLARKFFGEDAHIFLFGSRVDDSRRGGDIDLLVRSKKKKDLILSAKIDFLTELKLEIGDQKIDLVIENSDDKSKSFFYKTAKKKGIRLC